MMRSNPGGFAATVLLSLGSAALSLASGCESCGSATVHVEGNDVGAVECAKTGGVNAYTCQCRCESGAAGADFMRLKPLTVCLPPDLNECVTKVAPSQTALDADCVERVQPTVEGLATTFSGDDTVTCQCEATTRKAHVASCGDGACVEHAMPAGATSWTDGDVPYTNVAGDTPVCAETAIDPPPTEGIAGALFAPRTSCEMHGQLELVASRFDCSADSPCVRAVTGTAAFVDAPCTTAPCGVDLGYALDVEDLHFEIDCGFLFDWCEDVNISDLALSGISMSPGGVVLDADGRGEFAPDQVEMAIRAAEDGEFAVLRGISPTPTPVRLDRSSGQCALSQTIPNIVVTAEDESITLNMDLNLTGSIFNEPPKAFAGEDQVLECTSPQGAQVTLNASGSTDSDGNATWFAWRTGAALDAPVLGAGATPTVQLQQALNATENYYLRVFDAYAGNDDDVVQVKVVDTTAPVFTEVAVSPSCLWPPQHKYVALRLGEELVVKTQDVCDATPSVRVLNVVSDQPTTGPGDSTEQDILFGPNGVCLRSERSPAGGQGRRYTITLEASDADGNRSTRTLEVRVPVDGGSAGCPALPNTSFIHPHDAATVCPPG